MNKFYDWAILCLYDFQTFVFCFVRKTSSLTFMHHYFNEIETSLNSKLRMYSFLDIEWDVHKCLIYFGLLLRAIGRVSIPVVSGVVRYFSMGVWVFCMNEEIWTQNPLWLRLCFLKRAFKAKSIICQKILL